MTDFNDTEDEAALYQEMRDELEADGVDTSDIDLPGTTSKSDDGPAHGADAWGGGDEAGDDGDIDPDTEMAAWQADEYIRQQRAGHGQRGPSVEEDPIGYFESRLNAMEQQRTGEQMMRAVQDSETEILTRHDDYGDACQHLEKSRRDELARMLPDNSPQAHLAARQAGFRTPAEAREAQLNHDRISIARSALQSGKSPAQAYYDLAVSRGWQSKGGGSRGGGKGMSHDKLADLYTEDPEAFDREWDKMAKAGAL